MVAPLYRPSGRVGVFVSDIFREIEDELRRDNLLKLWSRYARHIIGGALLLVLIAAGVVGWRQYLESERLAQANRYSAALSLARQGKQAEAARLFGALARDGAGYGLPAAFQEAELFARGGDRKAAIEAYERIAASSDFDREYRDLAVLLAVMRGLPEGDPQTVIARLAPLTQSDNPWRASALDMTAAARLKAGDRDSALEIYQKLADDLAAPRGLRARAAEMVAALKS
jgi:hypothetical protein